MKTTKTLRKIGGKVKKTIVESNGFLTKTGKLLYPAEVHAFGIGITDGMLYPASDYITRLEAVRKIQEDVDSERHYFIKGWGIGQKLFIIFGTIYAVVLAFLLIWLTKQVIKPPF